MSNTIAILNNIRDNASAEYAARIPLATRDNITAIGNALDAFPVLMNEFTTTLIGKIGLTVFANKTFKNKLSKFKKGDLPYGTTVEEIFVEMASGIKYDETGANPLGRRKPDNIKVMYHTENRKDKYEVTVSEDQVKGAFRNESGVANLLAKLIESMYTGSEYDEYVIMKELLAQYEDDYFVYEVNPLIDNASGKEFIKTMKKAVLDTSFLSTAYNKAGVHTKTDANDLVLFVNKDVMAELSVEVLASAFNIGELKIDPSIVVLDNFGSMTDTYALLVDKDFFMMWDTLRKVKSIENPDGLFTNYFLHIWQLLSLSKFKNAIRFKKVAVV